ncbi:MAG: mannose-6-phosphate isomerase [Flavobacteriaceae bacterium]|nr:mannose-6-phosphate isomerase [Flavobacteriaceae bacterium]MCY4216251.1 mannose-6-phosphate isomerase [Flavobacteriaceae bacterium]MCY4253828.1 mannose-6-phosphate isomerase [Flavobacteriaceae bacterium]
MEKLYPLKFVPRFFYRIWGGHRLKNIFGIESSEQSIGEAWLISNIDGYSSRVAEGPLKNHSLQDLIQSYGSELLGNHFWHQDSIKFPLLIKLIDASDDLSIQVHPNDELANQRHNSLGKSELWYILEAEKRAYVLNGFNEHLNSQSVEKLVTEGHLMENMNKVPCQKGDVFYVPAGRPHAIGGGLLLAEIQQASDITYRLYDFNRIDSQTTKKRELHLQEALAALDYSSHEPKSIPYSEIKNQINTIIETPYFYVNLIPILGEIELDYSSIDSFVILMCIEGSLDFQQDDTRCTLKTGETLLLPAKCSKAQLESSRAKVLEISIV